MTTQRAPVPTRIATPAILVVALATLFIDIAPVSGASTVSGSGLVISADGDILTNAHVVNDCAQITVRYISGTSANALLVVRDEKNDLAVIRSKTASSPVAIFREGISLRAGDAIVALGYPLSGLLSTAASLSVGNVSALAGLRDDSRYLQISAPVQPGNSGGPLLDSSGHLVGIVTSKLDAALIGRVTGDIPQNVNFALKAEVAKTFLDSKGIVYQTAPSTGRLSPADIGDIGRPFTVNIECRTNKPSDRSVDNGSATPGSAQRAVLYVENSTQPPGNSYVGSVAWRTDSVSPGPGLAPELVVRADIKIPAEQMTVSWAMRRNTDHSLPVSYTIEITFKPPPNSRGGVGNIPGLLMKQSEQSHATPLTGLSVTTGKDTFLIGVPADEIDLRHDIQLLRNEKWLDIPIIYGNGARAILAVQKGLSGELALAAALKAWGQ
jgi:S1-C subfamily serine protease